MNSACSTVRPWSASSTGTDGIPVDRDKFRQLLLKQKQELLDVRESGRAAAGTVKLDQSSVGRLSRMDALQAQAMHQEAARRREQQLRAIEIALAKIESGDYGYCDECGEEIAEQRLLINPTVAFCISCSSRMEKNG